MKNARLIKRNPPPEQSVTEDQRKADSQLAINVRKSTTKWVREWQGMRQIDPRRKFAALFKTAD